MSAPAPQRPFDDAYFADPYAVYARLRSERAVHHVLLPDESRVWLVTREAEVRAGLADVRLSVNKQHASTGYKGFSLPATLDANLLNIDAADHLRLRRLVSKEFSPRRVEDLRARVEQTCQNLARRLAELLRTDGVADLVDVLATPLPLSIIGDLLGVPDRDRRPFANWVRMMQVPDSPKDIVDAIACIHAYLLDLIELRRNEPDGNLLSGLISVRDEGDQLSGDELVSLAFLILMAGLDNTQHVISSGILTLLQHRDQLAAIRTDASLLPGAVEEILRHTTPNHMAIRRFPTEDIEIDGALIPAGDTVLLCLAAAHRDPRRYPEPDRFDVLRDDKAHLALGYGIHYCLGAPLARMQINVALATMTHCFPRLSLAVPANELSWSRSFRSHSLKQLPITLEPAPRR
ncbi:cytochrome P450 [Streptomyces gardneri]|uniref:cytochrome P450 family protein n=1 Tax=Streptomyces gardneri TaxID=66892 RepID=UPI00368240C9